MSQCHFYRLLSAECTHKARLRYFSNIQLNVHRIEREYWYRADKCRISLFAFLVSRFSHIYIRFIFSVRNRGATNTQWCINLKFLSHQMHARLTLIRFGRQCLIFIGFVCQIPSQSIAMTMPYQISRSVSCITGIRFIGYSILSIHQWKDIKFAFIPCICERNRIMHGIRSFIRE